MLVDTHCHIHEASYALPVNEVLDRASKNHVSKMICVGTDTVSSQEAVAFAATRDTCYAAIGVHPHETKDGYVQIAQILADSNTKGGESKIVAVGEIGLDYFYLHSPRDTQIEALQAQMQVALSANLPIIFHVRDGSAGSATPSVWEDFWSILDNFQGVRGVLHSFTDTQVQLEEGLGRGLYVGVNGISTFTKDPLQQQVFAHLPLEKLLLETDAPFLTPVPLRGKVNEPAFVRHVAEHQAKIRGLTLDDIATATSQNAHALFAL